MNEAKDFLIKMLDAVDFEGDKDAFAEMYIPLIYEDAVYSLIQTLPEARRESVAKKWDSNNSNYAALASLLQHNFSEEQISETVGKTAEKTIVAYLTSVDQSLTDEQRKKLQKLSQEVGGAN